jgi:hypothetical protein
MWKIATICATGAVAAGLSLATAASAAPAFSSKPAVTNAASVVENVRWRLVCHGRWHHYRCHRVWSHHH